MKMSKESTIQRYIMHNALQTPDGTILVSRDRHDFKQYIDANGKTYMIDGGKDYVRSSANGDETYLTVYNTDAHEEVRKYFTWGTFGKNGDQLLQIKTLNTLTDEHIKAIIETQNHIHKDTYRILNNELKYRDENNEHIKESTDSI